MSSFSWKKKISIALLLDPFFFFHVILIPVVGVAGIRRFPPRQRRCSFLSLNCQKNIPVVKDNVKLFIKL